MDVVKQVVVFFWGQKFRIYPCTPAPFTQRLTPPKRYQCQILIMK